jgi:hypothetical protein
VTHDDGLGKSPSATQTRTNIQSNQDISHPITSKDTMTKTNGNNTSLADFIWKNADDLWGNFKHVDFGKVSIGCGPEDLRRL